MMDHGIIDYNLMYYLALFNFTNGYSDGYIQKNKQKISKSTTNVTDTKSPSRNNSNSRKSSLY